MSVKENIQIFQELDLEAYLAILLEEYDARGHTSQPDAYLVDGLPFYKPKWIEDHVSVLSFNYVPLPGILIEALVNHPELVSDDTLICWTIEQEVLIQSSMRIIREKAKNKNSSLLSK